MKKEASKKTLNPGSHSEMRFNAKCEIMYTATILVS